MLEGMAGKAPSARSQQEPGFLPAPPTHVKATPYTCATYPPSHSQREREERKPDVRGAYLTDANAESFLSSPSTRNRLFFHLIILASLNK